MEENLKENFKTIICMVKELIHGQMEEDIKVNILMIRSMYLEN
jgi:hypothetical protein